MRTKPSSEEAKNAVWAAYEALDEKHKRAITRHVAKASPRLFKYWVKEADLVHGCDQRKVVGREGTYGARLDKILKDCEDGNFAADVFFIFLTDMKVWDVMVKDLPDDVSGEELARLVDERAAGSGSEFAKLAAAFVKCYPPDRKPRTSLAEAADEEMSGLVARLDAHAVKLDGWAASLRLTGSLPEEDVAATVGAANKDAARLTELMRGHREATGCPAREFKTPADVAEHVKELCAAIAASGGKAATADFLRSLAEALRALRVTHRSAAERTRLSGLRDLAAGEVAGAADGGDPKWTARTEKNGREWLRWAFEIGDEKLEETQGQLTGDGYARLSDFIGVGESEWIDGEPSHDKGGTKGEGRSAESGTESGGSEEPENKSETAVAATRGLESEPATRPVMKTEPIVEATGPAAGKVVTTVADAVVEAESPKQGVPARKTAADGQEPARAAGTTSVATEPAAAKTGEVGACDGQAKVSVWEGKDIREVARAVADGWETVSAGPVAALAGKLVADGEFALAYHLVRSASELGELHGVIPGWIFGAVACGSTMQATDQSAITVLQEFFQQYHEKLFDELEGTDRVSARLLLAAGALEPALFFPITGAASVLQNLHLHKVSAFQALAGGVAEYGARGVGLPRAVLFSTISADDLKRKLEAVRAKAKEWLLERAPQFEIISRPGKDTWRAWISKSGPVGMLLGPVVAGQAGAIPELQTLAKKYTSAAAVDQEARHLYRNALHHRGELLRPSLNMIRRHTAEAIEIVDEWISVLESQPDTRQRYDQKVLAKLRKCFADHTREARAELTGLSSNTCPPVVRAGARACLRVVDDIARVLEGSGTDSGVLNSRSAHRLLHDDLLRITGLRLDENGTPRLHDYSIPADSDEAAKSLACNVVREIGAAVAEGLPTLGAAVKARGEAGDHESTGEILKLLEATETPEGLKRLEQERAQSITRHREAARRRLKQGQRALSDALTKGLYAPQEYERWAVRLESAERDMRGAGFLRFADVYGLCERLSVELADRKTTEIARLRKEIDRMNPSGEQRKRLDAVLAAGDVHTATDYMDRIRNQIGLPDVQEAEGAPFLLFFGKDDQSACGLIEEELRDAPSPSAIVSRVAKREPVKGLLLGEMQTTQAKEAAEFLRLWFSIKSARELTEATGSGVFGFFGMHLRKLVKTTDSKSISVRGDVWDLQIEPLESRDVCPSAGFGSNAKGHYRVVGYWRRPAAEDILQHARELGGGPVIVLYFGRMSVAERRSLAAVKWL